MVNKIYLKGKIDIDNEEGHRIFTCEKSHLFDFLKKIKSRNVIIKHSLEYKDDSYSLYLKYNLTEYRIGNKKNLIKIDLNEQQYDLINKAYKSISFNFEDLFKSDDLRNDEFEIIIETKVGYCNG